MEDIAEAFSHSTRDDPNMSQLQIQWKLDHEVQQAFKCLKHALTNCIKALGNVVDFKQKKEVTQTPVPVMEEPKDPIQEDQPKDDDYHNSDDYSDDESDYSLLTDDDDDDQEDELMIEAKSKTQKSNKPRPKSLPKEQSSIDYKEVLNNIKTKQGLEA